MSVYNSKEIYLKIRVKDNISDPRYIEFMKNWNFTQEDAIKFDSNTYGSCHSSVADKIITFIFEYKNGILHPDKCGTYEPLKHLFNVSYKKKYINWIAYPRGEMFMLKRRIFDIAIRNYYWAPTPGKPTGILPEYLCVITLWFRKRKKLDHDFLKNLLRDFCNCLGTDQGIMFDAETDEILLDISDTKRIGTHIICYDPFVKE